LKRASVVLCEISTPVRPKSISSREASPDSAGMMISEASFSTGLRQAPV
jgi:hypothetical protein